MNCWNFLSLTSSECLGQQHRLAFFHAAAGNLAFAAGTSGMLTISRLDLPGSLLFHFLHAPTHPLTECFGGTHLIQGDYWGNAAQKFFQDLNRSWSRCITSTSATLCWRCRACRNEDGNQRKLSSQPNTMLVSSGGRVTSEVSNFDTTGRKQRWKSDLRSV